MSQKKVTEKLVETKKALADKCDRLIKTTKSSPRRKSLARHAARFRRQAADLSRQ
jgi:hypothetical protein